MPVAISAGASHIPRRRGEYGDGGGGSVTSPTSDENAPVPEVGPDGTLGSVGACSPIDDCAYTTLRNTTTAVKVATTAGVQQTYQRTSKTVIQSKDRQASGASIGSGINAAVAKRSGTYPGAGSTSSSRHRHANRARTVIDDEERYLTVIPSFSWKHFFLAASAGVFAASAYYAIKNWENLVNTRQIYYESQLGGRKAHADFHLFDMLRKADVAPRYTLLEKIDEKQGWVLQMDVPGFEIKELELHSSGPFMAVRGTHSCPVGKHGRQDSTCVERHVSDEIRFPDDANMDTARAELENGVLRVFVKPNPNYKPGGRIIRIMDQAIGKVQGIGETLKDKLGIGAREGARAPGAQMVNIGHRYDDDWKFTAKDSEALIVQKVDSYIDWIRQAFRIPGEQANEFLQRVHQKNKELISQFRKGAFTVSDLKDQVYLGAEEAWATLRDEVGDLGDAIRQKAAHAADRVNSAADSTKAKMQAAQEAIPESVDAAIAKARGAGKAVYESAKATQREIDEIAADQAKKLKNLGATVKEAAKDKAREYAEKLKAGEEAAETRILSVIDDTTDRVAHVGEEAMHRTSKTSEHARDISKEAAHRAAHRAEEKSEQLFHRAKESAHIVAHRVSEGAEIVEDRAREKRSIDVDPELENQERSSRLNDRAKGFIEALKQRLWGAA